MAQKKGCIPWNKGIPQMEETKRKMSEANKGKRFSINTEFKKNMIPWNKGIPMLEMSKQKMRKKIMGRTPWNKNGKHSKEARIKMSISHKGNIFSKETKNKISESNKGIKSYLWKGGITPLILHIRQSFKSRQWRSDIFTRDNFTCQDCGQVGGRLNVHHIKSFSSIIQFYEITTFEEALECDELWNINNGITLCIECHKKTDNYCKK